MCYTDGCLWSSYIYLWTYTYVYMLTCAHYHRQQDDSALNRKIIRRILEGEAKTFSNAVIEEADDGTSAVSAVQSALEAGLSFDFIFMDFVMVSE